MSEMIVCKMIQSAVQNSGVGQQCSVSIRIYTMTKLTVKATESVTVYSALVTGKSDIS